MKSKHLVSLNSQGNLVLTPNNSFLFFLLSYFYPISKRDVLPYSPEAAILPVLDFFFASLFIP